jgi:hypothetical protein
MYLTPVIHGADPGGSIFWLRPWTKHRVHLGNRQAPSAVMSGVLEAAWCEEQEVNLCVECEVA